jgi:hypothetical protein
VVIRTSGSSAGTATLNITKILRPVDFPNASPPVIGRPKELRLCYSIFIVEPLAPDAIYRLTGSHLFFQTRHFLTHNRHELRPAGGISKARRKDAPD